MIFILDIPEINQTFCQNIGNKTTFPLKNKVVKTILLISCARLFLRRRDGRAV
jgi:hypothetical protein